MKKKIECEGCGQKEIIIAKNKCRNCYGKEYYQIKTKKRWLKKRSQPKLNKQESIHLVEEMGLDENYICPRCNSIRICKIGFFKSKQKWICLECGRVFFLQKDKCRNSWERFLELQKKDETK